MFNPTREQVRDFFFETWRKYRAAEPLVGLESVALEVALLHPEYHALLERPERHREQEYFPELGQSNPFLHMSLHLALEEQLSIDQPVAKVESSKLQKAADIQQGERESVRKDALERYKAELDAQVKVYLEQIKQGGNVNLEEMRATLKAKPVTDEAQKLVAESEAAQRQLIDTIRQDLKAGVENMLQSIIDGLNAPKEIIRDKNGRPKAVKVNGVERPVMRDSNGRVTGLQ